MEAFLDGLESALLSFLMEMRNTLPTGYMDMRLFFFRVAGLCWDDGLILRIQVVEVHLFSGMWKFHAARRVRPSMGIPIYGDDLKKFIHPLLREVVFFFLFSFWAQHGETGLLKEEVS